MKSVPKPLAIEPGATRVLRAADEEVAKPGASRFSAATRCSVRLARGAISGPVPVDAMPRGPRANRRAASMIC